MKFKLPKFGSCPLFGKTGSAYLAMVIVPITGITLILFAMLLFLYISEVKHLNDSHQSRLRDLASHVIAMLEQKNDLPKLEKELELFARSTPQAEFFKLHLFLMDRDQIIASTDSSAVGKKLHVAAPILKPFSFRGGEATVGVSVPVDNKWYLVAHEDITMQSASLNKKLALFAVLILSICAIFGFIVHRLFQIRIRDSIKNLKAVIPDMSKEFVSPIARIDISQEFQPLLEAWNQTAKQMGPAIEKLLEAEKKAAVILVINSIRHCLSTISDLLIPVSFLPSKPLSSSEINALRKAEHLLKELKNNLERMDAYSDPLRLCQQILHGETAS